MLNQTVKMLDMLKKNSIQHELIRICFWQSTGPIIGIREPTPLICGISMKNKRIYIFFFSVRIVF